MRPAAAGLVFGAALLARVAFWLWAPGVAVGDGETYHGYAQAMLAYGRYVNPDGSPGITWLPGWPATLALYYTVVGSGVARGMLLCALLGATTALALGLLGSRLFGPRIGIGAGLLYALWPGMIYYSGTLYSEDLFNLLLVLTLLALARGSCIGAGAGLGLASLVKAEPLVLSPVLLAALWSASPGPARFARDAGLLLGTACVLIAPWVVRNQLVLGEALLSANGGSVAWMGNHPGATGAYDIRHDFADARQHRRATRAETDLARNRAGWRRAADFVRSDPGAWLRLVPAKLGRTYARDDASAALVRGFRRRSPDWYLSETTWRWLAGLANAYWWAALALAALGLGSLGRWTPTARILVLGPLAAWLLVHVAFIGGARFHVPEIPSLALLAAWGLERLREAPGLLRGRRAAALGLAAAAGLTAACGPPTPPRHLLLVVVDTLRADHLGCYGHPRDTSPAIDALAAEGVRFARAYTTSSWTKPAVASILSGRYPSGHGVTDVRHRMPSKLPSLGGILGRAGFQTAAVISNPILSDDRGNRFSRGFERWIEVVGKHESSISTPAVTEAAIAELRRASRSARPLFLFVLYFDPHARYLDHPEVDFAAPRGATLAGDEPVYELQQRGGELLDEDQDFLRDRYDEEIRHTDAGIGRLLQALDSLDLARETLVVLTADHGEELLERGLLGHTRTLYEELVRAPLILRLPGSAGGRVIEAPVSLVSLVPTALELLGVEPAEAIARGFEGPSLAASIRRGSEPEVAPVFAEVSYLPLRVPFSPDRTFKKAVIDGDAKLIVDEETGRQELYRLDEDPQERRDRAQLEPERRASLEALLRGFRERAGRRERDAELRTLSPQEEQLLRDLGYGAP